MVEARLMPSRSPLFDSSTSGSSFSFDSLLLLAITFLTVADFEFDDFFDWPPGAAMLAASSALLISTPAESFHRVL